MKEKRPARPLPDASAWQPRDASRTLSDAFEKECQGAEERIIQGLQYERMLSIDNFDSGLPFEGLVRRELIRLMPSRYHVGSGLILDRDGRTAGKCDVVIFNGVWFPPIKSPVSTDAGQTYFPIEGVYGVGEIKQTISSSSLDEAMEKLVMSHRLTRPRTFAHRVVENREGSECPHGLTNPLFSFLLAGSMTDGETFQSVVERFFDISKQLKRLEMARALCVLQEGVVLWAFRDPLRGNEVRPAMFIRDDLFHPIFPVLIPASQRSPLCVLLQHVQQALYHTILGPEDLAMAYGRDDNAINIPKNEAVALPADKEWIDLLAVPCWTGHA